MEAKTLSEISVSPGIRQFLYPLLAGICIVLGFERYNLFPVLFFLPFFLNGMRQLSLRRKILAYWLMGIVSNLVGYHWISIVAQDFGGLPVFLAWGLVLLFSIFNNWNFLLWAYLEKVFGEKSNPFVIAGLFCVAEQVNPQVFPWFFGSCLDSVLVLYQTADLFGVIGLSFVAIALIHIPWWIWQNRSTLRSKQKRLFLGQLSFLLLITSYGIWSLNRYQNVPGPGKKSVGITLVQSNTSIEKYYGASLSRDERLEEFRSILRLSDLAIEEHPSKPHLLVWPESAVHFPILNSPTVFAEISDLAKKYEIYLTAGSVELGGTSPSGRRIYYNTEFVMNPLGEIVGKYRKIVLLAFGEYIPFLETFPVLEKWLPDTIAHFTRGTEKPTFQVGENLHWLPLICYEDIITGFINGFGHSQADFMVNITNDGWFGMSDASHLHKQMARPRAVEYRKPFVRALNTGSSQIIDAAGRTISKETQLYIQDYINATLYLPDKPPQTLYSLIGNLPVYGGMILVAFLWARRRFFAQGETRSTAEVL